MNAMTMQEILEYLPHRYPFLLIDRILELQEGQSIVALKNVTMNEPFFIGHFPNKPIMPGVLMIEAMAQAAAVLAYRSTQCSPKDGTLYYFAGIDNAKFRRVVIPGDQLRLVVNTLRSKRDVWKMAGEIYVDQDLVCSSEFLCVRKND